MINHLRSLLPPSTGKQFNTRAHLTMRLFHSVLAELVSSSSSEPNRRAPRLFSLLPRKIGFTISYIPISSMTFMKILSMGKTPLEKIRGDGRLEDHDRLWRKYFNIGSVETKASRFDCRIITDGKGVSIQMRRELGQCLMETSGYPKDSSIGECLNATTHRNARCVGVDPGMTDIATVAFSSGGGTQSFSSSHFSHKAGYKTSKRRTDKWNVETSELVKSIPTSMTTSMDGLERHVQAYLGALPTLLQHRTNKGYRSMRFFRYVGKQKAIEEVCDMIAPRDTPTIVGFGKW